MSHTINFSFLARSANLPTKLYILPSVISLFLNIAMKPIITGFTRPIFKIFHQTLGNFIVDDRSGPLFVIPQFWAKLAK